MEKVKNSIENIRKNIIKVAFNCKGKVHWGSVLSCVEIMYVLYGLLSNISNNNIEDNEKDEIIISKGQAALALYATLSEVGIVNDDFIYNFQKNGTDFPEEIMMNKQMRIPCSTGSLGLGMPYAVGVALKKKRKKQSGKVYVLVGDGECNEGSIWEAVMSAAKYCLDNLIMIIDYNRLQADGSIDFVMDLGNLVDKFHAFGWCVSEVDGHNCKELLNTMKLVTKRPHVVIAKTTKGKGISFMENDYRWHDHILDKELLEQACREVGIDYVRKQ